MVAVLMGDKYLANRQRLVKEVEHFSSFIHLIFEESARLSLIPVSLAAFFKIPAWKSFVSAVDESLTVGKFLILLCYTEQK
jgi:ecdysteroid 2-hydroxylase